MIFLHLIDCVNITDSRGKWEFVLEQHEKEKVVWEAGKI
jgi:hypothetical protein